MQSTGKKPKPGKTPWQYVFYSLSFFNLSLQM